MGSRWRDQGPGQASCSPDQAALRRRPALASAGGRSSAKISLRMVAASRRVAVQHQWGHSGCERWRGAGSPADSAVGRWVVARAAMEMMVVNTTDPMAGNETPDRYGQYPRLSGRQLAAVAAYAERRPTRRGEVLYDQGEEGTTSSWSWMAGSRSSARTAASSIWSGSTARAGSWASWACSAARGGPGRGGAGAREVLVVPPSACASCSRAIPHSGTWCCGLSLRRSLAIEDGARMGIVGSRSVTDTRRLRGFAARNRAAAALDRPDDRGPRRRCANSASRRSRPGGAVARPAGQAPEQHRAGPHDRVAGAELGRDRLRPGACRGGHRGELAAVVDAATDGLAAVALARSRPSCCRAACTGSRGYPGSRPGSEAELAERGRAGRHPGRPGGAAGRGAVTGQGGGGGVVSLADGSAIAARPVAGGAGAAGSPPPPGRVRGDGHPLRPAADGRPALGRQAAAQREPAVRPHERERRRALPARGAVPRYRVRGSASSGTTEVVCQRSAPQQSSLQPHRQPVQRRMKSAALPGQRDASGLGLVLPLGCRPATRRPTATATATP